MSQHEENLVLPNDEHNRTLVGNVHPSNWVNPEAAGRYNIVVIGAGTAGLITAVIAASLGATVALIEKHLMGARLCETQTGNFTTKDTKVHEGEPPKNTTRRYDKQRKGCARIIAQAGL